MRGGRKVRIKYYDESLEHFNKKKKTCKFLFILFVIIFIICFIISIIYIIIIKKNKLYASDIKHYDYLIVGAGLYGATFNYFAKRAGKTTFVVEKRDHVGGNLFCENLEGINTHKYGPHIFHTDNKKVWDFVNNLTHFNPFYLQTISVSGKKLYNLPFNMWTFNQLWNVTSPEEAQKKIEGQKYKGETHNLYEKALSEVGKDTYNKLIRDYTEKQWGRKAKNLPQSIIERIPKRLTFDGNYYNDRYQGIPEGCYNALIDKLLENTEVETHFDYNRYRDKYSDIADKIVYTGKIDEYFEYKYGMLQYRTVTWENEVVDKSNYQGAAIVNYPDKKVPYTRIIEYKHFEPYNKEVQEQIRTIIFTEYSEEWDEDKEAFYPINDEKNNKLYQKYKELADQEKNVIFGGRLAEYKYYDMDDIIEQVFKYWNV